MEATMNDKLEVIREAIDLAPMTNPYWIPYKNKALNALARLEALAAEFPDRAKIVSAIRIGNLSERNAEAMIGQYADRVSADVRKDRDYWKSTAIAFHDAIYQHIENLKDK
jgi:hypothetical protein